MIQSTSEDLQFQRNMMSSFIQIAALAILLGYCALIVKPFAGIVIWGVILAVAIYPLHLKFTAVLGQRPKLSATIISIIGLFLLLGPGWILTDSSVTTAQRIAGQIRGDSLVIPPPNPRVADWPVIGERVYQAWTSGAQDLANFLGRYPDQVKKLGEMVLHIGGALAVGLLHFTASIVIAGVCLMYANKSYGFSSALGERIAPGRGAALTKLSISTIRSVTNGVLGVAMIQAVLAGIGFAVMDVPAAGLLAMVVLVTAIVQIPAVLIMVPVILWAFSAADPVPATIFAVYAMLVALSDNVLKPMLLGRGVDLPVLVVLLGAIGGMLTFGVVGLFIGAVILGLGYEILMSWISHADISGQSAADVP